MVFGSAATVGLDIGSSAVRAAKVARGKGGASLLSFGQVPLPAGAVVDGEVREPEAVSQAISQLWKRAKIRSKKAVVGVANQRVIVREVHLPHLEEKEFRSSLRFQVADHIPMPVDDAELDYQIVDDYTNEEQQHMMRVLLVAAAKDMVETHVAAMTGAGIEPEGVDLAPLAVARAVSPVARKEIGAVGSEAVIDVGAGVTTIVVHQGGDARFVRILMVGGDDATTALERELGLSFEEAEAVKLDFATGMGAPEAQRVLWEQVSMLVEEVRGSLDYYLSQ
jgi:type IV pilus assembly protein PilM